MALSCRTVILDYSAAIIIVLLGVLLCSPRAGSVSADYESTPRTFFASREELVQGVLGESVILPCTFVVEQQADPDINVIWQKDKKTLTFNRKHVEDSRLSIVATGIHSANQFDLQIAELRASDEGLYRCIASFGNQFFIKNVTLLVKVPPFIEGRLTDEQITVTEGESKVLECISGGSPPPTVHWYKLVDPPYVKEMNRDKIAVGQGQRYVMNNVTRKCQGSFICIASNDPNLSSASKRFNITVQYKPTVALVNEEISQRRGLSTMVMCVITGYPLKEFYWEYRSLMLKPVGSASCESANQKHCVYTSYPSNGIVRMDLLIRNLSAADFGPYFCVARSQLGSDKKATNVLEVIDSFGSGTAPIPEVFKPVPSEVDDARPEIFTRQPPQPPPVVPGQNGGATDSTELANRHATGSTLQGTKAACRPMASDDLRLSCLAAAASLTLVSVLLTV